MKLEETMGYLAEELDLERSEYVCEVGQLEVRLTDKRVIWIRNVSYVCHTKSNSHHVPALYVEIQYAQELACTRDTIGY